MVSEKDIAGLVAEEIVKETLLAHGFEVTEWEKYNEPADMIASKELANMAVNVKSVKNTGGVYWVSDRNLGNLIKEYPNHTPTLVFLDKEKATCCLFVLREVLTTIQTTDLDAARERAIAKMEAHAKVKRSAAEITKRKKVESKWLRVNRIGMRYGVRGRGRSPGAIMEKLKVLSSRGEIQVSDADKVELDKIAEEK